MAYLGTGNVVISCVDHMLIKCRIIGFEELGNIDGFETAVLDLRLSASGQSSVLVHEPYSYASVGVIQKTKGSSLEMVYKISSGRRKGDDGEVFDLDD
jgi:hypothetical protein